MSVIDIDRTELPDIAREITYLESERPLRAIIYTRISSDDERKGKGVARQLTDCRKLCDSRRYTIVAEESDNSRSAFKRGSKRPAWDRVKEAIEAGQADVIVAWHNDRLSRNDELEALIKLVLRTRVLVVACMSGDYDLTTADGILRARIINDVAWHESDRKRERTELWIDERAEHGIPNGGGSRMFGYETDRRTPVPEEIAAIRWAADAILEGQSIGQVARSMPLPPTGKAVAWHRATLLQILKRPTVAGLMVRKVRGATRSGTVGRIATELVPIGGDFPAALDRPTWERLVSVLSDPARKRQRPTTAYLLSGGLVLDEHGTRLYGWRKANGVAVYKSYRPNEDYGSGLPSVSINGASLDALVTEALLTRADGMTLLAQSSSRSSMLPALREALDVDIAAVNEARETGAMPLAIFLAESARLAERESKLAAAEETERRAGVGGAVPDYMSTPKALRRAWPTMTLPRQRAILAHEIAHIDVTATPEAKRGKHAFMPERVSIAWQDGTLTQWNEDGSPVETLAPMADEAVALSVSRTLAAHLTDESAA